MKNLFAIFILLGSFISAQAQNKTQIRITNISKINNTTVLEGSYKFTSTKSPRFKLLAYYQKSNADKIKWINSNDNSYLTADQSKLSSEFPWKLTCYSSGFAPKPRGKYYVVMVEYNNKIPNIIYATDEEFRSIEDILKTLYKANLRPLGYTYYVL